MEILFLILGIGFAIYMVVALFKYASFIHHYPHPESKEEGKEMESVNPSDKKPPMFDDL